MYSMSDSGSSESCNYHETCCKLSENTVEYRDGVFLKSSSPLDNCRGARITILLQQISQQMQLHCICLDMSVAAVVAPDISSIPVGVMLARIPLAPRQCDDLFV